MSASRVVIAAFWCWLLAAVLVMRPPAERWFAARSNDE
jgi:hypothetical protein